MRQVHASGITPFQASRIEEEDDCRSISQLPGCDTPAHAGRMARSLNWLRLLALLLCLGGGPALVREPRLPGMLGSGLLCDLTGGVRV